MPFQQLVRDDVVRAPPSASLAELATLMQNRNVGSVVITNDRSPVGIVTDRDLSNQVIAEGKPPDTLRADNVMTPDPTSTSADIGLYETANIMSEHGVRRLPICDDRGELCGIIAADDVTELLADEQQHLASIIQAQRPAY